MNLLNRNQIAEELGMLPTSLRQKHFDQYHAFYIPKLRYVTEQVNGKRVTKSSYYEYMKKPLYYSKAKLCKDFIPENL